MVNIDRCDHILVHSSSLEFSVIVKTMNGLETKRFKHYANYWLLTPAVSNPFPFPPPLQMRRLQHGHWVACLSHMALRGWGALEPGCLGLHSAAFSPLFFPEMTALLRGTHDLPWGHRKTSILWWQCSGWSFRNQVNNIATFSSRYKEVCMLHVWLYYNRQI